MTNSVFCTRYGIELDLRLPDLGHPEFPDLWSEIYGEGADPDPELLQCVRAAQGLPCGSEAIGGSHYMYIQRRRGKPVAVHRNHGVHVVTAVESDEHKALKERICRDAQAAGFDADMESRSADGRRRTDVIVEGVDGIRIGWEPQMSPLTASAVRRRTALAERDGLTSMWLTKSAKAELINRAPWSRIRETPWEVIASGEPLQIIGGVNTLETWRCDSSSVIPCPVTNSGRCGKSHGQWVAARNLHLNKLVEFSAAGEYRVLHLNRVPGFQRERYLWAPRAELDRYREIVPASTDEESEPPEDESYEGEMRERALDQSCTYGLDTGIRAQPARSRDTGEPIAIPHMRQDLSRASDRPVHDEQPAAPPRLLDWSSSSHWNPIARPCIHCGGQTNLQDDHRRPMHKVCAEAHL